LRFVRSAGAGGGGRGAYVGEERRAGARGGERRLADGGVAARARGAWEAQARDREARVRRGRLDRTWGKGRGVSS